ncbi:hypothetical protein B0H11DRAFT_1031698 [Mycena galericulata]|nr:hypothetical protein B0H11DRAFT_1031698 [Mycena galericulata]
MPPSCILPDRSRSQYRVSVSTIEDLGRTLTNEEQEIYEEQLEFTRRRHFKTFKGRPEAVWPPHLEAALIQGLYQYVLDHGDSIAPRIGHRNSYLSKTIFAKTNQKRTSKQISSRLQQLAAGSSDSLRNLIRGSSPFQVLSMSLITGLKPSRPGVVNTWDGKTMSIPVTVAMRSATYPSFPPEIDIQSSSQSQCISLRTYAEWQPHTTILRGMEPTVSLSSTLRLSESTVFELSWNNQYHQTVPAAITPIGVQGGKWRYTVSIGGASWNTFRDACPDPNVRAEWTISQWVFRAEVQNSERETPVAEILYNFEAELLRFASACPSRTLSPSPEPEMFSFPPPPRIHGHRGSLHAQASSESYVGVATRDL